MTDTNLRVLQGNTDDRCPRCRRKGMAGKRHKERPRGSWCSGEVSAEEAERRQAKERAMAEFRWLRSAFFDLYFANRYDEARALAQSGTRVLNGYRLREVKPKGEQ